MMKITLHWLNLGSKWPKFGPTLIFNLAQGPAQPKARKSRPGPGPKVKFQKWPKPWASPKKIGPIWPWATKIWPKPIPSHFSFMKVWQKDFMLNLKPTFQKAENFSTNLQTLEISYGYLLALTDTFLTHTLTVVSSAEGIR